MKNDNLRDGKYKIAIELLVWLAVTGICGVTNLVLIHAWFTLKMMA